MFTKKGTATVTYDNQIIPIAYDGDCAGASVSAPTIEAALKEFDWKPGYVGFKFAEAVSGKVQLDNEEITFTKTKPQGITYLFAQAAFSSAEFAKAATAKTPDNKYKAAYDQLQKMRPDVLADSTVVIYDGARGVRFLEEWDQKSTVLINKQGAQIWPSNKP